MGISLHLFLLLNPRQHLPQSHPQSSCFLNMHWTEQNWEAGFSDFCGEQKKKLSLCSATPGRRKCILFHNRKQRMILCIQMLAPFPRMKQALLIVPMHGSGTEGPAQGQAFFHAYSRVAAVGSPLSVCPELRTFLLMKKETRTYHPLPCNAYTHFPTSTVF